MAKDYAPYKARVNALEQIDILLNNALENYQSDFDYYEALHNEQPEEDWRYQELQNADFKVSIMKEVIDWLKNITNNSRIYGQKSVYPFVSGVTMKGANNMKKFDFIMSIITTIIFTAILVYCTINAIINSLW